MDTPIANTDAPAKKTFLEKLTTTDKVVIAATIIYFVSGAVWSIDGGKFNFATALNLWFGDEPLLIWGLVCWVIYRVKAGEWGRWWHGL